MNIRANQAGDLLFEPLHDGERDAPAPGSQRLVRVVVMRHLDQRPNQLLIARYRL
jgi:hypothetical protein